jgi:hypothetical protein
MSWSMVDAYAAHGVRYLSQGPNYIPGLPDGGDRIGSTLREQGDKPYWWKSATGRDSVLVWTAGQGYGGWHGFTAGAIKERGTRKIAAYMNELAANGCPYDMVQWRYNIVSDNGPVDSTISDFVRDWNQKYASPHLILANVSEMMQRFDEKYGKSIPTWSGDFTPYWEDGAYSTAKEEGEVRVLSAQLSQLIDDARTLQKPIDPDLLYRAKRSIVMWHEHTWGAWNSIDEPDNPDVIAQWVYKKAFADSAALFVRQIEKDLIGGQNAPAQAARSALTKAVARMQEMPPTADKSLERSRVLYPEHEWLRSRFDLDSSERSRSYKLPLGGAVLDWPPRPECYALSNGDSLSIISPRIGNVLCISTTIDKHAMREKESLHLALPFNIPNATVRIGIGDTCVTPESGRIPGSNNDYFCAQRWIDVSNDTIGVTVVCPQGALWEVGEVIDERRTNPGLGTNAEKYKRWKSEAKSSSTIYLYALNNYWHTNFKADQEGPIVFDVYLKVHGPFDLEEARRFGSEITRH